MALRSLSRAPEIKLPPPAFDVRGWEVRTQPDEEKVGKVEDMLLDGDEGLRFLEVDLGLMKKHVLVPAHRAHVDDTDEIVWVEGVTRDRFEALPEHVLATEDVDADYARRLDLAYEGVEPDGDGREGPPKDRRADDATHPLARLEDLGEYDVSGDDADPRGWTVVTAEGEKVGEVSELLVDTAALKARYLVCDLDEKKLELEPLDRHVLIPVSRVHMNPDKKRVLVNALFAADLATYPVYGGLPLTRAQSADIERRYPEAPARTSTGGPGRDYGTEHFFSSRSGAEVTTRSGHDTPRQRDRSSPERTVLQARSGERATVRRGDDDVRVEVHGDDIIIERRPRG